MSDVAPTPDVTVTGDGMYRTCVECGRKFPALNPLRRFCGATCQRKAAKRSREARGLIRRVEPEWRSCLQYDKPFRATTYNKRYCRRACQREAEHDRAMAGNAPEARRPGARDLAPRDIAKRIADETYRKKYLRAEGRSEFVLDPWGGYHSSLIG